MVRQRVTSALLPAVLACWLSVDAVRGAEPKQGPPSPAANALRFLRLYVPADQVEAWPRGTMRYVPVPAAEMQRLLTAATERSEADAAPSTGALAAARYTAALSDEGLLTGQVEIDVRHDASDVRYVPLSPLSVALRDPAWIDPSNRRPALLGVDREGVLRLGVSQPGTLRALWTVRGKRTPRGEWEFLLGLPAIPSSRLTVDLPQRLLPWVESAAVREVPGGPVGSRRWQIDWTARADMRLLIVPESPDSSLSKEAVRQTLAYDFSPRGLELTARLTLDLSTRPREHLKLRMGPGLQLLDVRIGDTALSWSALPSASQAPPKGAQLRDVVVEFPEPLSGGSRVVQLRGVAPLVLGQLQTLPSIVPLDLFWQEGSATLSIPGPMALNELNLTGCRQTKVSSLAGAAGQSLALQYFDPEARVEVRIDRPETPLSIESATMLDLTPRETRCRLVADCSAAEGERFDLSALVLPGWQVDQVESEPVGGLEHWATVRDRGQTRLDIRLTRAVTPKRPLRLILSGQLGQTALAKPLSFASLRMLQFNGAVTHSGVVGLASAKPHQLQIRGDEDLTWLDPAKLDAPARSRFEDWSAERAFRDDPGARRMEVGLVREAAGHAAEIQVTMHVHRGSLEELARIMCRPDSGGLDRLLVHISQVRAAPFRWSIAGDEAAPLSANRLSDAAQREAGYAGGETWEVVLDRSRTAPFTLVAQRTLPWEGNTEGMLMAVAPVAEQSGMITVRGDTADPLHVENLRLQPIPNEYVAAEEINTSQGAFRFDPERDAVLPHSTLLITRAKPGALSPGAVAWKARYDGRFHVDGQALHQVVLYVENRGQRQIHVELPAGAEWAQASVDDVVVEGAANVQRFSLDLPAERRFPRVRIQYVSREQGWASWQRLNPLLPTFDFEVLDWDGVLWTPPGFHVVGGLEGDPAASHWQSRLAGPLARDSSLLNQAAALHAEAPGVPAGDLDGSPWASAREDEPADRAWEGWTANRVAVARGKAPAVVVVREALWTAALWSIYLLSAAALGWLFPRRMRSYCVLLLGLALAALLAPAPVAQAATTAWLGAATAAFATLLGPDALRWLSARNAPPRSSARMSGSSLVLPSTWTQWQDDAPSHDDGGGRGSRSTKPRPTASSSTARRRLLFLLAALTPLLATGHTWGNPPAEPTETRATEEIIYKILIPIGKDRQPSGDTWYVPLEFYRALQQRTAVRGAPPHGWLTTGVRYRGALTWNLPHTRLDIHQLRATYDLEVLGRQVHVRLPLDRTAVVLAPAGAKLDGRSVEPVWDERGLGLVVDVAEPGRHRVVLDLKPLPLEGDVPGVELATPPLPTASLELELPALATGVEVPSAQGNVETDASGDTLVARLGGTDKLSIRWPQPSAAGELGPPLAEQLLWLKIAPGAVTVDARLKLLGLDGRRGPLLLELDPSLRLLSAENGSGQTLATRLVPGSTPTAAIESANGFAAGEEVTLSLLCAEASALGRFRLPEISVLGVESAGRWLAVSVDPSLTYSISGAADLTAVAPEELTTRWQTAGPLPAIAYRLPPGPLVWTLATKPRAPRTSARQSLALSLAAGRADVRYVADLETTGGSLFQHRLSLPRNLTVRSVVLTQAAGSEDCVARWSQTEGGLTILLNRPVTGVQRLLVEGTWLLTDDHVPPPDFHLGDEDFLQSLDLAVYRQPGIDALPTDAEAVHEMNEPTTELLRLAETLPRGFGRPLGNYHLLNPRAATIFRIVSSAAKTKATQVTTLSRKDGVWQAEVDVRLHVQQGTVDAVRLLLPPAFRGPLRVVPDEPFQIVDVPGQRGRQLVVRPRETVRDKWRLNVSGPLVFVAGERVAAPHIELLLDEPGVPRGAARPDQFLVLPKQVEQQRVEWELRGVQRQDLPQDAESPPVAQLSVNTYRVLGPRFQAALASVEKIARAPRIRLADVRLRLDETGAGHGVAAFDLEPAGLWKCIVTAPAGVRPLRAAVGSLAVPLLPLEENRWEFSLVSNQLPQRIEILFQAGAGSQRGPVSVPWIEAQSGPLEVLTTLWTVSAPRGTSLSADRSAAPLSPLSQQWLRLDSITSMLNETGADDSADILARWYEPWALDLHEAWREIGRYRLDSAEAAEALAARLQENRKQHQAIAQRLRTRDVLDRVVHATIPARPAARLWRWASPEGASPPLRISVTGAAPQLKVTRRALLSGASTTRVMWTALAACGLGLLVWPRTGPTAAALLARWPWAVALILAVLCYFVLLPWFFFPVLALLSAAAWRVKARLKASTVSGR